MLAYVGAPNRPIAIDVRSPSKGWRSGRFDWDSDGEQAVLEALRRLAQELDR
jgi:hypothetical protein